MKRHNSQSGFAVLYATMLILGITLAMVGPLGLLSLSSQKMTRKAEASNQALFAAESGVEDISYRIKNFLPYSPSYAISVGSSTATVSVATQGITNTITVEGQEQSNVRKLETVLAVSANSVAFFYGVHVGSQGLTMGNGSVIAGNVFSNGDIKGNGSDKSTITGTAKAAGSSSIEDIAVNEDAYANEMEDCAVLGTAFYVAEIENCSTGTTQVLQEQVQPQSFPITQAQFDAWKAEAEAGGTQGSASFGNNTQVNLGPKKINGSLSLGNTATLTMGGTLWVTGAMSMGNSVTIQLDPGYGNASGVLILDGPVSFGNGAVAQGSGQSQSKLMVVSLYGSGSVITLGNTGIGDIFYAPNGVITIGNGFVAEEVTGKGLTVGNNATVTYESGLVDTSFSSGPGAGFEVTSWKEIE
ncbi:MAG: hypothetical protein Q7R55_00375 [Candidatus Wildermuthbacteria bacterium]|nr:hypothetical protein [Candidatus Wildermuthbacteria bacterium]